MNIDFSRNKPFWPYIVSFLASTHGYTDALSRLIVKKMSAVNNIVSDITLDRFQLFDLERYVNSHTTPELFVPALNLVAYDGDNIDITTEILESELDSNFTSLAADLLAIPLRTLLLSCYESIKEDNLTNDDPLWQFFRHIRNASGHNGRFLLRGAEPVYPATWRDKSISADLQNFPLLQERGESADNTYFLKPADVLNILDDIEHSPNIIIRNAR